MNKIFRREIILIFVIYMLQTGCQPSKPRPVGSNRLKPVHFWTAKEAYEEIKPRMQEWHEDAIIVGVSSILADDHDWRIREDGRGPWWAFIVQSPSAMKETMITLLDDQVILGADRRPGVERSVRTLKSVLPLDEMLDTDEVLEIANQIVTQGESTLADISPSTYDGIADETIPLSWRIGYSRPTGDVKHLWIFINTYTGDVIRNDFLSP